MGSRRQSHSWHGQPGMRNGTVTAALAAAASLVIRRTSDQIVQSRCKSLEGVAGPPGRAEDHDCQCALRLVEHPQTAGWHCERSELVIW